MIMELLLNSVNVGVLGAIFSFSGTRPSTLGIRRDVATLGLCPPTPNCVSTAEEINDPAHFIPPWTYNPEEGRGRKKPITQAEAMKELVEVVQGCDQDGFTPRIVKQTDDYLYAEFESAIFGFVDDVEFFFPKGNGSIVEYRSASRLGASDGDINRKRIRALRVALQKKGWASVGY
eukprot:jgi/Mesvir1/27536/Mv07295-RA.1